MTAADQWPQPDKPSLEYARRLSLPTNANTIIYFPSHRSPDSHRRPAGPYTPDWWY